TFALWAVSILLVPYGLAGLIYLSTAVVAGALFFGESLRGFSAPDVKVWAKKLFVASLLYLTVLFASLIIDAL
ncbi:MAG: protoheme IX farnesyltransferase, partial [Myxococcales bacterium]|nr:protoheme IX farnesyltransferase [Myxococcales bacterium]